MLLVVGVKKDNKFTAATYSMPCCQYPPFHSDKLYRAVLWCSRQVPFCGVLTRLISNTSTMLHVVFW